MALLAAVVAAGFAVPSTAQAAGPYVNPGGLEYFPISLSGSGGKVEIQEKVTSAFWTCKGSSMSGEWTGPSSGTGTLLFTGCYYGGPLGACTTPGYSSGTVVAANLNIEPIYLDKAQTQIGLLLSPKSGPFAPMKCGPLDRPWNGSLIGSISAEPSSETGGDELVFSASGANQQYTQVEEEGPSHQLNTFGGTLGLSNIQYIDYASPFEWATTEWWNE